jgi:hypothetical protein
VAFAESIPKGDFVFPQVCVIEVPEEEPESGDEESVRVFCLENLIEGDYIKYNSNSGFVDEVIPITHHRQSVACGDRHLSGTLRGTSSAVLHV